MAERLGIVLNKCNKKKVMFMRVSLITCFLATCLGVLAPPMAALAQDEVTQGGAAQDEDSRMKAVQLMLQRAEIVRFLAAEHIAFLASIDDLRTKQLMDDAAQVMAYSIVCNDDALEPVRLNQIAAETTLQIALLIDKSPINAQISDIMGSLSGPGRMMLVADVSSAVLMFKVGRRRGLFDALLTDFGTDRFCKGMGSNMRGRYHSLAAQFEEKPVPR